jgi:hypothetical protein
MPQIQGRRQNLIPWQTQELHTNLLHQTVSCCVPPHQAKSPLSLIWISLHHRNKERKTWDTRQQQLKPHPAPPKKGHTNTHATSSVQKLRAAPTQSCSIRDKPWKYHGSESILPKQWNKALRCYKADPWYHLLIPPLPWETWALWFLSSLPPTSHLAL